MFINIKTAMEKGVFCAPESVTSMNVADTQMVCFSDAKPSPVREKVGGFIRVIRPKEAQKYAVMVVREHSGRLKFCWKSNVKPKDFEIFEQKLLAFRS